MINIIVELKHGTNSQYQSRIGNVVGFVSRQDSTYGSMAYAVVVIGDTMIEIELRDLIVLNKIAI